MIKIKTIKIIALLAISSFLLNGCKGGLPGADARKFPADPAERIKKNMNNTNITSMFIINNNN